MIPARMKANGNFSDASVERFYSVKINRMMNPVTLLTWVTTATAYSNFRCFTDPFSQYFVYIV